jgi:hypothetical protein
MRHKDPIIDEIWQAREAMLKKYDGDLGKLCDALRAEEAEEERKGRRIVRLPPKKPRQIRRAP